MQSWLACLQNSTIYTYNIHHHLFPMWHPCILRYVDNTTYVTGMYSCLTEVVRRHSQVSTHPGYMVVTHHMTNCSPYRMIGTTSSKPHLEAMGPGLTSPGGRILTFLPWCRCVVTISKLQTVNKESKSLLAYHLSRLL
jgi:hypothetical protein